MKAIKVRVEVTGEPYTALKEGIVVASATKDVIELYFKNLGKHGVSIHVSPKSAFPDLYALYDVSAKLANAQMYDPVKKAIANLIKIHSANAKDLNSSDDVKSRNQSQWEVLENLMNIIDKL